jgi:hypothetical protein
MTENAADSSPIRKKKKLAEPPQATSQLKAGNESPKIKPPEAKSKASESPKQSIPINVPDIEKNQVKIPKKESSKLTIVSQNTLSKGQDSPKLLQNTQKISNPSDLTS